jgi:hypothetical protein
MQPTLLQLAELVLQTQAVVVVVLATVEAVATAVLVL